MKRITPVPDSPNSPAWRRAVFCDRVCKALIGKRAEIEVASLALGSQAKTRWLPFQGAVYHPK